MTTNTNNTTTTTTININHQYNNSGIDPKEALSILSSHGIAKAKAKAAPKNSKSDDDGCESHSRTTTTTDDRRTMGQTIDLFPSNQNDNNDNDVDSNNQNNGNNASSSPNHNQTKERIQILQTQKSTQLLRTLFQLQEERVVTYRRFDDGLNRVLQTGDLTQYPHLTLSITATFTVLSGSIKEMEGVFRNRTREPNDRGDDDGGGDRGGFGYGKEIADWIRKLQNLERDKLNYTAALHLEKIRGRNEEVGREIALQNADRANAGDDDTSGASREGGGSCSGSSGNERIAKLLQDSIVSLQAKVNKCVQGINEVLEELRYIAVEMEEEEEEQQKEIK